MGAMDCFAAGGAGRGGKGRGGSAAQAGPTFAFASAVASPSSFIPPPLLPTATPPSVKGRPSSPPPPPPPPLVLAGATTRRTSRPKRRANSKSLESWPGTCARFEQIRKRLGKSAKIRNKSRRRAVPGLLVGRRRRALGTGAHSRPPAASGAAPPNAWPAGAAPHRHDGAAAVGAEHVVRHPDGDALPAGRVDGVRACGLGGVRGALQSACEGTRGRHGSKPRGRRERANVAPRNARWPPRRRGCFAAAAGGAPALDACQPPPQKRVYVMTSPHP
jgi:hypothetical protein